MGMSKQNHVLRAKDLPTRDKNVVLKHVSWISKSLHGTWFERGCCMLIDSSLSL